MGMISRGLFLVLLGIDGSGKTSLLSSLHHDSLVTASWRDLRNHELPSVMAPDAPTVIKNRLSDVPRAMFIGGHIVAQYEYLVRPVTDLGKHVLLDSYWYKVLAKEDLFDRLHPGLAELRSLLPVPDAVILLDVSPQTAYARKHSRTTPYERFDEPHAETGFVRFQNSLLALWEAELYGHPSVYRVDGERDFDSVLASLADVVELCTSRTEPAIEALS
ncbi:MULTISPECIES: dTMP kinase [unclassified Streptomyces]|uniref:dTMP kinase n=1 Tax=unclassified Streptomyces TaxID=2593676 RepID=UPI00403CE368